MPSSSVCNMVTTGHSETSTHLYQSARRQSPKTSLFMVILKIRNNTDAPSFGGEVKPSVTWRRFAACKRALNLLGSRNLGKITGQFLAHISTFRCWDLSRCCERTNTWRRKWERLKAGESNGKLPPRTCPGCSVPEPH